MDTRLAMRCKRPMTMRCRSRLFDRCQWDTTERVFYVYRIGRFHNKMYYTYGDTTDIYATDLRITAALPFKERVLVVPREEYQKEIDCFTRAIEPHADQICVQTPSATTCFECFQEPHDQTLTVFHETLRSSSET